MGKWKEKSSGTWRSEGFQVSSAVMWTWWRTKVATAVAVKSLVRDEKMKGWMWKSGNLWSYNSLIAFFPIISNGLSLSDRLFDATCSMIWEMNENQCMLFIIYNSLFQKQMIKYSQTVCSLATPQERKKSRLEYQCRSEMTLNGSLVQPFKSFKYSAAAWTLMKYR